jgi:hypothetical protein
VILPSGQTLRPVSENLQTFAIKERRTQGPRHRVGGGSGPDLETENWRCMMAWDEELERLTDYVQDNLGEAELDAAIARAYDQLTRSEPEALLDIDEDRSVDLTDGDGIWVVGDDGRQWSLDQLYEVLRGELRSVVRPN